MADLVKIEFLIEGEDESVTVSPAYMAGSEAARVTLTLSKWSLDRLIEAVSANTPPAHD